MFVSEQLFLVWLPFCWVWNLFARHIYILLFSHTRTRVKFYFCRSFAEYVGLVHEMMYYYCQFFLYCVKYVHLVKSERYILTTLYLAWVHKNMARASDTWWSTCNMKGSDTKWLTLNQVIFRGGGHGICKIYYTIFIFWVQATACFCHRIIQSSA